MSNHQKDVELKASIADFVGPICIRLKQFKEKVCKNELKEIIDQIGREVIKTNDVLVSRGNWDRELTGHFGQIERHIDYWVDHNDMMTERDESAVTTDLTEVHNQLSQNLRVKPLEAGTIPCEKATEVGESANTIISEVGESSNTTIIEVVESSKTTITEVGESSNTAITEVGELANTIISEVGESSNTTITEVGESLKTTITEVGESSNTAIAEVGESANTIISEVGESSNTTINEVGESSKTTIPEVGESSNTAITEVGESANIIISEVGESSNTTITEDGESSKTTITEVGESSNTAITEVGESLNRSNQENGGSVLLEYLKSLNPLLRQYLYSLSIFPENTVLKKRLVIYWWIGLGIVPFEGHKSRTAEQFGEIFFSDLVDDGILIAEHRREHNKVIDRCTIEPTFHKQLNSICEKHGYNISKQTKEGTWRFYDSKVLLNRDQMYLNSKDISKQNNFHVVHLGSWRYTKAEVNHRVEETTSKETKSEDHIEVDETDFLKNLGEQVTYLSLQGISGIEELHESIGKLENLMILDLRACHNLEKLPQKPRSRLKPDLIRWVLPQEKWFKKLTVLDISESYLLDHMPKWISELSTLEVLKGFVVGGEGNKNRSCRLSDLSDLHKLRKLGIRFAKGILGAENISGLNSLKSLSVLTIIWGKNNYLSIPSDSFPENLQKLDIRCYPNDVATEMLNPAVLKNLKRLYIRGGEITQIPCNDKWEVEILRLRFLKKLEEIDPDSFKSLKYVQCVECPKLKNLPQIRGVVA